ncbi:MAG: glycosyl transferase, partial [Bacteroidales bacterium]|nr:glycosyl transferase [Bacteroidales bacterium]
MQIDTRYAPDYIFETSWEVCNKVGGIYTVLSTRANSLQELYKDRIIFIGPDVWIEKESPWFTEDPDLYSDWKDYAYRNQQLQIRIGRWNVPGNPVVFLVKFN